MPEQRIALRELHQAPLEVSLDRVFNLRRQQYEQEFGADYEKPHGFARFLASVYRLIPKIGPFRAFSFSVPTPEAERLPRFGFSGSPTSRNGAQ